MTPNRKTVRARDVVPITKDLSLIEVHPARNYNNIHSNKSCFLWSLLVYIWSIEMYYAI